MSEFWIRCGRKGTATASDDGLTSAVPMMKVRVWSVEEFLAADHRRGSRGTAGGGVVRRQGRRLGRGWPAGGGWSEGAEL
jgi:hypothetical protein